MVNGEVYKRMRFIEDAVAELETFEQVLVEEKGYAAETYGKVRPFTKQGNME